MRNNYRDPAAAILLLLASGLSACKVSKDVGPSDVSLPAAYRNASAPADSSDIGGKSWENIFTDPALKGLIADALIHNNDLQIALKNIEAAGLQLKQAKLGNVPSVSLGAAATLNRPSDNSLNGLSLSQYIGQQHVEDYSIAASLSWEADIWGKIRSRKAEALAAYLESAEAKKALQTRIVSDVSKGYYNLLMLDAQLGIARKNVLLNDSTLNITRLQYSSGQVTSLAVQQAQAQKLSAENLVPSFEQQIAVQENALSILCGRYPAEVSRDTELEKISVDDYPATGLPSALLRGRPDVRQAELALSRANASVGYAKAGMYPSLTITAQGGLNSFRASNWFNIPASLFGAVAGGLTQPLFAQKRLKTAYQVAQVRRDQSVIQFRQSVLVAVGEVSDAMVKLDKYKQQQDLAFERTSTLEQATKNSQLLFKNGLATYLEVITAQGNVLQSELEVASIKKSRLDAAVDLYRSLGGGWK